MYETAKETLMYRTVLWTLSSPYRQISVMDQRGSGFCFSVVVRDEVGGKEDSMPMSITDLRWHLPTPKQRPKYQF